MKNRNSSLGQVTLVCSTNLARVGTLEQITFKALHSEVTVKVDRVRERSLHIRGAHEAKEKPTVGAHVVEEDLPGMRGENSVKKGRRDENCFPQRYW